jgi:hypothetical protein
MAYPVLHVIERIVAPLRLRVDATFPWVDTRLPDGSRVQTKSLSPPFCARRPDHLQTRRLDSSTTRGGPRNMSLEAFRPHLKTIRQRWVDCCASDEVSGATCAAWGW